MNKNPMNRRKPTQAGEKTRANILRYLEENETLIVPVSLREIGDKVGIPSTSIIEYHLRKMEEQGLIRREAGKVRFIKLVKDENHEK